MRSQRSKDLMPDLYNTRAKDMWDCISKSVDFTDRTVIDIGCGRGDIAMMAWTDGARVVFGIDRSGIELVEARLRSWDFVKIGAKVHFMRKDIESWDDKWPGYHDIAICTSVLPYIINPDKLLKNICRDSGLAIIECQYAGDGPGFDHIKDDDDMKNWLSKFDWISVKKIGSTNVESRPGIERSIWLCTK